MEEKLDLILKKLEVIEKHLDIKPRTIYDEMSEAHSVKDTAKILGCTEVRVRQYIKWDMLKTFKVGKKPMVISGSIKKLIDDNKVNSKNES
jgi:predicted transcriptional regulator